MSRDAAAAASRAVLSTEPVLATITFGALPHEHYRRIDALLSSVDPRSRSFGARGPAGSVEYRATFCVDTQGGNAPDDSRSLRYGLSLNEVPLPLATLDAEVEADADEEAARAELRESTAGSAAAAEQVRLTAALLRRVEKTLSLCFNCGAAEHPVEMCTRERDTDIIRANSRLAGDVRRARKTNRPGIARNSARIVDHQTGPVAVQSGPRAASPRPEAPRQSAALFAALLPPPPPVPVLLGSTTGPQDAPLSFPASSSSSSPSSSSSSSAAVATYPNSARPRVTELVHPPPLDDQDHVAKRPRLDGTETP